VAETIDLYNSFGASRAVRRDMFPGRSQHLHDGLARVQNNLLVANLIGTQNPDIKLSKTPLARIVEQGISGKGIIDYLPRLPELFTDLQRVNINSGGGEILYRHTLGKIAAGLMSFLGQV
jgi:hypothetical protein